MSSNLRRDDVDKFYHYDIHIPSRTLFLGTEVDELMAESFLKGMHLLEGISKDIGITIIMNNIGGDEYHGLAIYDAIATSKCHVTIVVYGHAMSMGSWILQAADERVLAPHATVMLHYGSWVAEGSKTEVKALNAEMERLNCLMEDVYLRRMKEVDAAMTPARLKKLLNDECYLTASDAIAKGLADRLLEKER